ncbi:MAG: hypothetical protein AAFP13_08520 [Pseudomonadota bacterium]
MKSLLVAATLVLTASAAAADTMSFQLPYLTFPDATTQTSADTPTATLATQSGQ